MDRPTAFWRSVPNDLAIMRLLIASTRSIEMDFIGPSTFEERSAAKLPMSI